MIKLILSDENCIEWKNGSNIANPTFFTADNLNRVNAKTKEALTTLMSLLNLTEQTFGENKVYSVAGAVNATSAVQDSEGRKITDTYALKTELSGAKKELKTSIDNLQTANQSLKDIVGEGIKKTEENENGEASTVIEKTLTDAVQEALLFGPRISTLEATMPSKASFEIEEWKNVRMRVSHTSPTDDGDSDTGTNKIVKDSVDLFNSSDTPFNLTFTKVKCNIGDKTIEKYFDPHFVMESKVNRTDYDYLLCNINKEADNRLPRAIIFHAAGNTDATSTIAFKVMVNNEPMIREDPMTANYSGKYCVYVFGNLNYDFIKEPDHVESDARTAKSQCLIEFIFD